MVGVADSRLGEELAAWVKLRQDCSPAPTPDTIRCKYSKILTVMCSIVLQTILSWPTEPFQDPKTHFPRLFFPHHRHWEGSKVQDEGNNRKMVARRWWSASLKLLKLCFPLSLLFFFFRSTIKFFTCAFGVKTLCVMFDARKISFQQIYSIFQFYLKLCGSIIMQLWVLF